MATLNDDPSLLQLFQSKDGHPLAMLSVQICPDSRKRFILWQHVQASFAHIDHLEYNWGARVHFMVDQGDRV